MKWENLIGNSHAKRAIEVSLAGDHPIQFVGSRLSQAENFALYMKSNNKSATHITPCPCGFFGDSLHACYCESDVLSFYRARFKNLKWHISIEIIRVNWDRIVARMQNKSNYESEENMRERVREATMYTDLTLDETCTALLKAAHSQLQMTYPVVKNVISVARTIANLAHSERISAAHLAEAIQYLPNWIKQQ